jgi:hypothetical protein
MLKWRKWIKPGMPKWSASDTDLGSKVPKKVLSKGIWYAQVEKL